MAGRGVRRPRLRPFCPQRWMLFFSCDANGAWVPRLPRKPVPLVVRNHEPNHPPSWAVSRVGRIQSVACRGCDGFEYAFVPSTPEVGVSHGGVGSQDPSPLFYFFITGPALSFLNTPFRQNAGPRIQEIRQLHSNCFVPIRAR